MNSLSWGSSSASRPRSSTTTSSGFQARCRGCSPLDGYPGYRRLPPIPSVVSRDLGSRSREWLNRTHSPAARREVLNEQGARLGRLAQQERPSEVTLGGA